MLNAFKPYKKQLFITTYRNTMINLPTVISLNTIIYVNWHRQISKFTQIDVVGKLILLINQKVNL